MAVAADLPPIGTESEQRLSIHMVQHLLIGDLAALLIAIAVTGPLLRPILTLPGLRPLRWLVHPLVAVPLWVLVYYGWHIPVLYQAALRSDLVHATEHAMMFGAGLAMWMGLLGPLPKPAWFGNAAALAYIVVMRLAGAAIANVFIWSGTPFYPYYDAIARSRGINAAADQSISGAIWMLEGSLLTVGVFAWIFARWITQDSATQELIEYAEGMGIELDRARAHRAVAAGADDRLRRRLDEQAADVDRARSPRRRSRARESALGHRRFHDERAPDTANEAAHVINGDIGCPRQERAYVSAGASRLGAAFRRRALRSALMSCRDPVGPRYNTAAAVRWAGADCASAADTAGGAAERCS